MCTVGIGAQLGHNKRCTVPSTPVSFGTFVADGQVVDGHSTRLRVWGSHFRPVAELRCGFASRQKRRNFLTCLGTLWELRETAANHHKFVNHQYDPESSLYWWVP